MDHLGNVYYAEKITKKIYRAFIIDQTQEVIHEELFPFKDYKCPQTLKFITNSERNVLLFQEGPKSLFKISDLGYKNTSVNLQQSIYDIQISSNKIYVLFETSDMQCRDANFSPGFIEIYNLKLEFQTKLKLNWNLGLMTKVFTLEGMDYIFKIEDMGMDRNLKVYQVTDEYELVRKRKHKLGSKHIDIKGFYLAKELDKKWVFIYHADNKIQAITAGKKYFYFHMVNDFLALAELKTLSVTNGIWGWSDHSLNYVSPVYQLFEADD